MEEEPTTTYGKLLVLRRKLVNDNVLDADYGYRGDNGEIETREPLLIELDNIIDDLYDEHLREAAS